MARFARLAACAVLGGAACSDVGREVPTDRPVFPTGIAVTADGSHLVVVSSNFDLEFDSGAVLVADLDDARAAFADGNSVAEDPWVSAVSLPALGDRPVIDDDGTVFVITRGQNLLHELRLDGGDLTCGDGEGKNCVIPPHVLQLDANDPDEILLLPSLDGGPRRGLVTHLSSGIAELFQFDPDVDDPTRLTVESDEILFGEAVGGIRSAALRDPADDRDAQVFVALQTIPAGQTVVGATALGVFDVPAVGRGDDVVVEAVDVTALTGSLFARNMVLVPPVGDGSGTGIILILRGPDALARFDYDDATGSFSLTRLSETCVEPTDVVFVDGDVGATGHDRVLVTCQGGETIQAVNPLTLDVEDSVRFFGRNPFAIAVAEDQAEAYVSFFLDDSVGMLRLVDDDGNPKLLERGRLGRALPPPETGRE